MPPGRCPACARARPEAGDSPGDRHWGANNSFRDFVLADPERGRAIVASTNGESGPKVHERVIVAITGHDQPAFLWL